MSPLFAALMVIPCLAGIGMILLSVQAAVDTGNPQIVAVGTVVTVVVVAVLVLVEFALLGLLDYAMRLCNRSKDAVK